MDERSRKSSSKAQLRYCLGATILSSMFWVIFLLVTDFTAVFAIDSRSTSKNQFFNSVTAGSSPSSSPLFSSPTSSDDQYFEQDKRVIQTELNRDC
ncbi:hypothetical protein V2J09_001681 [Rumex salicifolius]